jgi:hypothetical protein
MSTPSPTYLVKTATGGFNLLNPSNIRGLTLQFQQSSELWMAQQLKTYGVSKDAHSLDGLLSMTVTMDNKDTNRSASKDSYALIVPNGEVDAIRSWMLALAASGPFFFHEVHVGNRAKPAHVRLHLIRCSGIMQASGQEFWPAEAPGHRLDGVADNSGAPNPWSEETLQAETPWLRSYVGKFDREIWLRYEDGSVETAKIERGAVERAMTEIQAAADRA